MRKFIVLVSLLITYKADCQFADILSWSRDEALENGIRIQTKIPVGQGIDFHPVIMIDGYNYSDASTISLKLAWFTRDAEFANATASSGGGFAPRIFMKEEDGMAIIYFVTREISTIRFKITGVYQTYSEDEQVYYSNWNVSDAFNEGVEVIYHNEMRGDTRIKGQLILEEASIPHATIGTADITGLNVSGNGGITGNLSVIGDANVGQVYARGNVTSLTGFWVKSATSNGVVDFSTNSNAPQVNGRIRYSELNNNGVSGNGFDFFTGTPVLSSSTPKLRIRNDGIVCIGCMDIPGSTGTTTTNISTLLAVKGEIVARKVRVTQTGWADYVFAPSYELRSLQSVEEYIKEHGHLPDVPSAKEVENDGVDIGTTQATLLRKIEELTLYVIEQGKQLSELKYQLSDLSKAPKK